MRLNDALKRVTLIAYLLSLSGFLAVAWLAHNVADREREAARWVRHTEGVIGLNNQVLQLVQRLESAERAYLLTGHTQFTQGLKEQIAEVYARQHDLQVLTSDNPLQQKHIAALHDMTVQKLELIEARIYLHDKVGPEKARESVLRSEGREGMELINGVAGKIEKEEQRLLAARTAEHNRVIERMEVFRNATVVLSIVFLSVLFWYLSRLRNRKREVEQQVEHLAYHDSLTGLPNRRLLLDRLQQNAAVATRQTGHFAVLFLDLDGFKKVNDTLGHDSGDLLLQQVGERLQSLLRESDTVARLGGDEFVIGLMLMTSIDDAVQVADKVVAELARPFTLPNGIANIGASIGISMYPEHGDDAEALLMAADKALYQAKTAGKSCHMVYASSMTTTVRGLT
jgi:diguanylate cyclase (GGDEF)-like protein